MMYKKLLSFTLALSLVGSSDAGQDVPLAQTEQQKIALFKEVVKTATEAATEVYPDRGWKTAALCGTPAIVTGIFGIVIGCFIASLVYPHPGESETDAFGQKKKWDPPKVPTFTLMGIGNALGHAAAFAPYLIGKQYRENKKNTLIIEQIIAHYTEHPEAAPAALTETMAPLIAHYREHKKLPQDTNSKALLNTLTTALQSNLYQQIQAATTEAYPELSKKKATLLLSGLTSAISVPSAICLGRLISKATGSETAAAATCIISLLASGPLSFALYEKLLQYRETQKNNMIIEHLIEYIAENPSKLNDDQMAFFAPLIAKFKEKKSKNPAAILAQLQAAL